MTSFEELLKQRKQILREINGRRQRRETFSHLIIRLVQIEKDIDKILEDSKEEI